MSPLEHSRDRLRAVILEVNRLASSDFPHRHSADVLRMVGDIFEQRLSELEKLDDKNDPSVVQAMCSESLTKIFTFLPLLGFILRSTNVRNSFEVYGPTLRLARCLLGNQTELLVSSEWNYSPFVFRPFNELPNVVLIGLPACESENPLLLPLAGHELGHSIWREKYLGDQLAAKIRSSVESEFKRRENDFKKLFPSATFPNDPNATINLFYLRVLSQTTNLVLSRCEETFCDFVGIRLFAEGYLHAFGYLLAPGVSGPRSLLYPCMTDRIINMITAGSAFNAQLPPNFKQWFIADQLPVTITNDTVFISEVSDLAMGSLTSDLIDAVRQHIPKTIPDRSQREIDKVYNSFELVVPAAGIDGIANVINAGWKAYNNEDLWRSTPEVFEKRREVLCDLILKNFEILEIEEIMRTK